MNNILLREPGSKRWIKFFDRQSSDKNYEPRAILPDDKTD